MAQSRFTEIATAFSRKQPAVPEFHTEAESNPSARRCKQLTADKETLRESVNQTRDTLKP